MPFLLLSTQLWFLTGLNTNNFNSIATMAKFAFTTENICCFPRHTNSLFNNTSLKHRQLLIFSSKQRSQLRVFSAIRGKESVTETESVITGLRVDELDNSASASDAEGQEEGGEVGFDWNWPPWKNLPQRYKLIGTTSLAFVVCNMDKVVFFFLGISWYTLSSSEMIFLLIELPWVMWLQGNRKVKECWKPPLIITEVWCYIYKLKNSTMVTIWL